MHVRVTVEMKRLLPSRMAKRLIDTVGLSMANGRALATGGLFPFVAINRCAPVNDQSIAIESITAHVKCIQAI